MLIYVAHESCGKIANIKKAKKITHDLQIADLDNSYVCPLLLFSHLKYQEIEYNAKTDLFLDILSVCDKLIVASKISKRVAKEIEFANLVGMEVEYLENP